jgi:hypoxanthine-DNA glycosylase
VLILGSLPGEASLRAGQYYAHPRNLFWRLAGGVIGADLAPLPYPARLAALEAAGIGLWDVIASARRRGSLDAAIRDRTPADVAALVAQLPALRAVGFNGGMAARHGRAALAGHEQLALIELPSSSPAFAAMPLAAKQAHWQALAAYLG